MNQFRDSKASIITHCAVALVLAVLVMGASPLKPSAWIAVVKHSAEVDPAQGAAVFPAGLGARITRITATSNGRDLKAERRRNGALVIDGRTELAKDTRYELQVTVAGLGGVTSVRRFILQTVRTPQPLLTGNEMVVRMDSGIPIKWNIPVNSVSYELPPGVQSRMSIMGDGTTTRINLINYEQARRLDLKITGAIGKNGQRMTSSAGYVQRVATTTPLKIDLSPPPGMLRAPRQTEVTITFGEEVANPEAAKAVFSVDPPVPGKIVWTSANQFKFLPEAKWDYDTEVKVTIKRGSKSFTGLRGNSIDREFVSTFTTAPLKLIDINLSNQVLVAYEDGVEVFSCSTVTGKSGYSTPAGNFRIYEKDDYVDMQSSPGDAEYYRVDNVPYVMWVVGGVGIHGAYWRSSFGYTDSHGCINVSVSNAKWLYGWTPVGTPVVIHY